MLFNSYDFLLIFLPACLAGYFLIGRRMGLHGAVTWLSLCSIGFYAWWDWRYAPLLLASISGNALAGYSIVEFRRLSNTAGSRRVLWLAVLANLALLCYFKYANFLLDTIASASGSPRSPLEIILPIGISFFTFTQIAYVVDAWRGEVDAFSFRRYFLFVTYFPHLIAGPVLHHREMMGQFSNPTIIRPKPRLLAVGLSILSIGLFKKVWLADSVSTYASPLFGAASRGDPLTFLDAWLGSFAYSMQLYFDFSAYSDMAIGLSLMFGIRIPMNFNSPYQAVSIIDFWRRWHLSLSRFLRDYLYVPLGGSRCTPMRQRFNLMATMLLGGLWHGAGWTYVAWGGLHGAYLIVNHGWRTWRSARHTKAGALERRLGAVLTFLAVMVAWVFFRADSFDAATRILSAMGGRNGIGLPTAFHSMVTAGTRESLASLGFRFEGLFAVRVGDWREGLAWLALTGMVAFLCPNTYQWFRSSRPAIPIYGTPQAIRSGLQPWTPSRRWALGIAAVFVAAFIALSRPSEFLYFQF
jgi:D-alanyl-lipoteichoic acid acyltransferase DltB (MBOAT superfamily)